MTNNTEASLERVKQSALKFGGVKTAAGSGVILTYGALNDLINDFIQEFQPATVQEGKPSAYLVNYYELTKGGNKKNVTQASLEPYAPTILMDEEPKVEERILISVTPLFTRPPITLTREVIEIELLEYFEDEQIISEIATDLLKNINRGLAELQGNG